MLEWSGIGSQALTVRQRRRVRRDSTLNLGGTLYEVSLRYLAGQVVNVATSIFDGAEPIIELDEKRVPLACVDAGSNGKSRGRRGAAPGMARRYSRRLQPGPHALQRQRGGRR